MDNKVDLENLMWVERYRPKRLEDVVNQKDIVLGLQNLIKNPLELPHLLFTGPAGVGKTTAALCIARQILGDEWKRNTLELNASDERGIKMVRERVKEFAAVMTLSHNKNNVPFRIIILDEADEMTSEAQTALRRIIEDSSITTRFIIICNYISQIIEPIQSRCVIFRFTKISKADILSYLKSICKKEDVVFEDGALSLVYDSTSGDLRHSINILQAASGMGSISIRNITVSLGISGRSLVKDVLNLSISGNLTESRKKLFELIHIYGMSEVDFLKFAYHELINSDTEYQQELLSVMADYDYRLAMGAHPEIQLTAFLAQIGKITKKNR